MAEQPRSPLIRAARAAEVARGVWPGSVVGDSEDDQDGWRWSASGSGQEIMTELGDDACSGVKALAGRRAAAAPNNQRGRGRGCVWRMPS